MSANSELNRARADMQEIACIFRKSLGWWNVADFGAFAKRQLVELNAIRAQRGDWANQ